MRTINVYVDESGIVAKTLNDKANYFIIAMLFVAENEGKLKSVFKNERLKVAKRKPELYETLCREHEIKGSLLSEEQKRTIYEKIQQKCVGDFELGIVVLDNNEAKDAFRSVCSRTFNFLIKDYLLNCFAKYSRFRGADVSLNFIVDERNTAPKARFTLEDYLNTELVTGAQIFNDEIKVKYNDSKGYLLLQAVDFFANTAFRMQQKNSPAAKMNMELLGSCLCNGKFYCFPLHYLEADCIQ